MASVESPRGATSAAESTVRSKPRSRRLQLGGITDYYKYFEHLPVSIQSPALVAHATPQQLFTCDWVLVLIEMLRTVQSAQEQS